MVYNFIHESKSSFNKDLQIAKCTCGFETPITFNTGLFIFPETICSSDSMTAHLPVSLLPLRCSFSAFFLGLSAFTMSSNAGVTQPQSLDPFLTSHLLSFQSLPKASTCIWELPDKYLLSRFALSDPNYLKLSQSSDYLVNATIRKTPAPSTSHIHTEHLTLHMVGVSVTGPTSHSAVQTTDGNCPFGQWRFMASLPINSYQFHLSASKSTCPRLKP